MKQIWMEGDPDDDRSLADDLSWVVVVLAAAYFGAHLIAWWLR